MSDEEHPRDSEGDGERPDPTVADGDRLGDADGESDRSAPVDAETGTADTERDDSAEISEAQAWAEPDHDSTEDGVLDPEELDISQRDGVKTTDEGQFVISTGQSGIDPDVPAVRVTDSATSSDSETERGETTDTNSDESVSGGTDDPLSVVETDLAALSSRHAAAVVARDGQTTGSIQTASNSRPAVLEAVLRWYASRVDDEAPPDETLRRLLAATALDLGVNDDDREG